MPPSRRLFVPLRALMLVAAPLAAFEMAQQLPDIDEERLLRDLSILAHDSMEGRRVGTAGNERARRYLVAELEAMAIPTPPGGRTAPFPVMAASQSMTGVNVLGMVAGTEFPSRYMVVSAHYDHLGVVDGATYNGADDNASGTAALLTLADLFSRMPPRYSIIFAAFDAEEMGIQGAQAFLSAPPVPRDSILLNVNLDMVSRSAAGELYAAGTYHYPFLEPFVNEVAGRAPISLLKGHDSPEWPGAGDWTDASDHGPFHRAGIPFLYFGVEDHEGYHRPSDDFEEVTPAFFGNAVRTIVDFLQVADRAGGALDSAAALGAGRP